MRKILAIAGLSLFILASCGKGGDTPTPTPPTPPDPPVRKKLSIKLSKDTLENNGFEAVKITVLDTMGADITALSQILIDGIGPKNALFYPTVATDYTITATSGTQSSSSKKLVVTVPAASPYPQKMVVEDYTGMWCGWCPRIAYQMEAYIAAHPECIGVGIHYGTSASGSGSPDPYSYQYVSTLGTVYNPEASFPTAILNRTVSSGDLKPTEFTEAMRNWAPLGISISSDTATAGTISGNVTVKFNVTSAIPMNISIMLVENKLFADQHKYADSYGPAGILTNFEYKNVLRKIFSSNITDGDAIPVGNIVRGGTYTVPYSFTTSGKTSWNGAYTAVRANCKIVAIVTYGTNNLSKKGVINVQEGVVGKTTDYVN